MLSARNAFGLFSIDEMTAVSPTKMLLRSPSTTRKDTAREREQTIDDEANQNNSSGSSSSTRSIDGGAGILVDGFTTGSYRAFLDVHNNFYPVVTADSSSSLSLTAQSTQACQQQLNTQALQHSNWWKYCRVCNSMLQSEFDQEFMQQQQWKLQQLKQHQRTSFAVDVKNMGGIMREAYEEKESNDSKRKKDRTNDDDDKSHFSPEVEEQEEVDAEVERGVVKSVIDDIIHSVVHAYSICSPNTSSSSSSSSCFGALESPPRLMLPRPLTHLLLDATATAKATATAATTSSSTTSTVSGNKQTSSTSAEMLAQSVETSIQNSFEDRVLCLDRVYLAVECGLQLNASACNTYTHNNISSAIHPFSSSSSSSSS
eukprot:CAMPEP_0174961300 /NCGR_PEP_ID=MMETSP0004_2-20121128/4165_1 /TAXON_ID=420556 /ORGANISM="Ochromonas sp., Strain CCMP1393" /LENGTH=371 /DNA_ID=CAMNT_0016209733 /DNA_START=122 /DNA_END=1233 /DNA_ORIENTATION=-